MPMSSNSFIPTKELNVQELSVSRDNAGFLKATIEGGEYLIKPMRCFPLTEADRYVGLCRVTSEGMLQEEIVLITDIKKLDEHSRQLIEEELRKEYSLTRIKKIFSVEQRKEMLRWHVETESGKQTLEVQHHNDIFMLQPTIVVIEDTEGNVFLIDPTQLDPKSQGLLEIYR